MMALCNLCFSINLKIVTGCITGETVCEHTQRPLKCILNLKHARVLHTWKGILLEKHCFCEIKNSHQPQIKPLQGRGSAPPFFPITNKDRFIFRICVVQFLIHTSLCSWESDMSQLCSAPDLVKDQRLTLVLEMPYLALELLRGKNVLSGKYFSCGKTFKTLFLIYLQICDKYFWKIQ